MTKPDKNAIKLHMHSIAVQRGQLDLIEKIHSEICELGIAPKRVTAILNNTYQPTKLELAGIASVLNKYKHTTWQDLLKNPNDTPTTAGSHAKV